MIISYDNCAASLLGWLPVNPQGYVKLAHKLDVTGFDTAKP